METTQLRFNIKYLLVGLIIGLVIGLIAGYFIARSSISTVPEVDRIKGATITGSVSPTQFEPIKEEKPDRPLSPMIVYKDRYQPIDSAEFAAMVIADYELKRTYRLTAFDNNQGKLELFPVIQYNRLSALDYNFTPMIERQTISKTKVWQPFLSGSYSTLGYIGIGGGVFYHNIGVEYQYQVDYTNGHTGHMFGGKYKF